MKKYLIILLTFSTLLVIVTGCQKENISEEVIRPLIEVTTADIPTFNRMTQTKNGKIPRGVTKIATDSYSAEYEFKWISEDGDYAYFDIRIMDSNDNAIQTLTDMHNYYTNPIIAESIDKPAIVGDISYLLGREFIRDNLIIRIHTSDRYDDFVTEIASYIDSKILVSKYFKYISQVKPVIKEFKIEKNPVIEQSQTPLTIQIKDPNNTEIIYQWRFDGNSDYGGITTDDSGNYFYTSSWYDSENNNIGLTLIAINEYGFCADSTINIQIKKE